jgi:hypothetical protein
MTGISGGTADVFLGALAIGESAIGAGAGRPGSGAAATPRLYARDLALSGGGTPALPPLAAIAFLVGTVGEFETPRSFGPTAICRNIGSRNIEAKAGRYAAPPVT